jgi:hypothetical protein
MDGVGTVIGIIGAAPAKATMPGGLTPHRLPQDRARAALGAAIRRAPATGWRGRSTPVTGPAGWPGWLPPWATSRREHLQ